MIFLTYPGIGKSSLVRNELLKNPKDGYTFCDLDISTFSFRDDCFKNRKTDWFDDYMGFACEFNDKGVEVFLSSNINVINTFIERYKYYRDPHICDDIFIITPILELEDEWIKIKGDVEVYERSKTSIFGSNNNNPRYSGYHILVKRLMSMPYKHIYIKHMDYDLRSLIKKCLWIDYKETMKILK